MSRFKQRFGLVLREQQVDKVERGYIGELFTVAASAQFGDKPLSGIDACGRDVVFPVVLRPQFQCARPDVYKRQPLSHTLDAYRHDDEEENYPLFCERIKIWLFSMPHHNVFLPLSLIHIFCS